MGRAASAALWAVACGATPAQTTANRRRACRKVMALSWNRGAVEIASLRATTWALQGGHRRGSRRGAGGRRGRAAQAQGPTDRPARVAMQPSCPGPSPAGPVVPSRRQLARCEHDGDAERQNRERVRLRLDRRQLAHPASGGDAARDEHCSSQVVGPGTPHGLLGVESAPKGARRRRWRRRCCQRRLGRLGRPPARRIHGSKGGC